MGFRVACARVRLSAPARCVRVCAYAMRPRDILLRIERGVKVGAEIVKNKEKMAGYGCEKIPYIVVKTLENIRQGTI